MATAKPAVKAVSEATPVEHESLGAALAAFQRTVPNVRKGNQAAIPGKDGRTGYTYDYADLSDVTDAVLPLLGAQGLAWHNALDTDDQGNIVLGWELMHGASGQTRTGRLPIGRAGTDWRSLGSSITYARRYALTAATGVAPGGDDDDAAASVAGQQRQTQAPRQSPVAVQPERLPEGIYDLSGLTDLEAVRALFVKARAAGHLNLLVGVPDAAGTVQEEAFGKYLTDLGNKYAPAPDEAPADAPSEEDAEAAAIAAHEASLAAQEPDGTTDQGH